MANPIKFVILFLTCVAALVLGAPVTSDDPTEVMANLTMVEWIDLTSNGIAGGNNSLGNILIEDRYIPGRGFYAFCNTDDCQDCGNGLGLNDNTCWNERNRHSIIASVNGYAHAVTVSPRPGCPCQSHCAGVIRPMGLSPGRTICARLGGNTGLSYRMVTSAHCPPNNC